PLPYQSLELSSCNALEFSPPDAKKFPCLSLAFKALQDGGNAPTVLNATNEVAVTAFLDGKIKFTQIPFLIQTVLVNVQNIANPTLADILETDRIARTKAKTLLEGIIKC
ncbi:MAG: 1-deoxy-D-xylulose-5-phosphate reductoisomerase, partial [Deltaproteobacteria bacterium]